MSVLPLLPILQTAVDKYNATVDIDTHHRKLIFRSEVDVDDFMSNELRTIITSDITPTYDDPTQIGWCGGCTVHIHPAV